MDTDSSISKVQASETISLPKDDQKKFGLEPVSEYEATIALFRQWESEAAQMTPEQQAEEDAVWVAVMKNLQNNWLSLSIPNVTGDD